MTEQTWDKLCQSVLLLATLYFAWQLHRVDWLRN